MKRLLAVFLFCSAMIAMSGAVLRAQVQPPAADNGQKAVDQQAIRQHIATVEQNVHYIPWPETGVFGCRGFSDSGRIRAICWHYDKNGDRQEELLVDIPQENITVENSEALAKDSLKKLADFFEKQDAARQKGELLPEDSFIQMTAEEKEIYDIYVEMIKGISGQYAEALKKNPDFRSFRIDPLSLNGTRGLVFYISLASAENGKDKSRHYYKIAHYSFTDQKNISLEELRLRVKKVCDLSLKFLQNQIQTF